MGHRGPPVFRPPEHDFDTVAAFVASLAVSDGLFALFPTGDAGGMQIRLPLSFDASPNRATFGGLFGNARAPMQSPTSTAVTNRPGVGRAKRPGHAHRSFFEP